jgi:hypothetical protein
VRVSWDKIFTSWGRSFIFYFCSSICLWTVQRKKPIFKQGLAHGFNDVHSETEGLIQTPRWITAIASLRYSDLFASGALFSLLPLPRNPDLVWV